MNRDEILTSLKNCARELDIQAELTEDTHLINDLQLDSLDRVELTMSIEDAFRIEIPDEDAERVVTVKQVLDYLQMHPKIERTQR